MTAVAAPPRSPYKGLSAFEDTELDALFFFGREREQAVIVANLLASRLTVLYGESGVGKSSILRAAVVRELRRTAPEALVAVHDTWSGDPVAALADARDAEEAYLILDQFEEYFVYRGHEDGPGTLLHDLPELLRTHERLNVLISLREDALAQLDAFKARLPAIFANQLRLDHLDRDAARAAIVGPVTRWNELAGSGVVVEPELVEAVLDEVAAGKVDLGARGVGAVDDSRREDRIEAPYLQLVMERIWDAEHAHGSGTLRLATLRELGGAATIVREHVENALDELDAEEKDVAASMFDHLVTPSGTKIAHGAGDLAQYASVPEDTLARVLATLNRERILRTVDGARGAERYEIFHDVLAEPVLAWRLQRQLERERAEAERRHRRVVRVAVAATAAFAIVAGLAIFAFTQRSDARAAARDARARALEATALQQLSIEPQRSMLLALDAAHLEPGPTSEAVLRQALIAARLRDVLTARGPVRAVAISPDGRVLAAASTDGRTRLYALPSGRFVRAIWHRGRALSVAFSPDGSLLAAGDDFGQVRVADARTGELRLVLRHRAAVTDVAFDRAGTLLLSASVDGTARLWSVRSGRVVRVFRNLGPVSLARFGPRGLIATVAADRAEHVRARLFDLRSGRLRTTLPERGISDVEFSPDGHLVATTSHDGATRLRPVRALRRVRVLDDGGGAVLGAAFSPDGRFLATAGDDGAARVWLVANGSRYFFFPGHLQRVTAVAWSHDGKLLADASADGTARLLGVGGIEAGSVVATLAGHEDAVGAAAFGRAGSLLATASEDGTARLWNARAEEDVRVVGEERSGVVSASLDSSGRRAVSVGADGTARVWDVAGRRLLLTLDEPARVLDARFSPDGRRIVTASADGTVDIRDSVLGKLVRSLDAGGSPTLVRFSPSGALLAAAASNGAVRIWHVPDGRPVARFEAGGAVVSLGFDRDSRVVLTATAQRLTVFDLHTASRARSFGVPGGIVRAALSPSGRVVATAGADEEGRLYDARTGRLLFLLRGHKEPLTDVAFSADGSTLVTTSVDARPHVWEVASGKLLHVLVGHFGTVSTAAFSPDGRWIVTAGPITAGLWPTETGRLLFYIRGHTKLLTSVAFAAGGRRILTASLDGRIGVYDCGLCGGLNGLIELARRRLERTAHALTPRQRERYLHG